MTLLTEATDNRVQSRGTQLLDEYFQEGQSRQPYGSQEMLDASSGGQRAIFFCAPFVFVPVAQYVDNALLGRLTPPPGLETPVVFDVLRSLKYLFRIIVRSYQEYERYATSTVPGLSRTWLRSQIWLLGPKFLYTFCIELFLVSI